MHLALPLDCGPTEIANAIRQVQARARVGRTLHPSTLAQRVARQIHQAQQMADLVGVALEGMLPSGAFWEPLVSPDGVPRPDRGSTITYVEVNRRGVTVSRGMPSVQYGNGTLQLRLLDLACPVCPW